MAILLDTPNRRQLWEALNRIPDNVMLDYLADNIVDDAEIEDITNRLKQKCIDYGYDQAITGSDHDLIRQLVRHAVDHIRHQMQHAKNIEAALCQSTLGDIRSAMGALLNSGQIKLGVADVCYGDEPSAGSIPDERPEDYDEEAENLI